MRAAAPPRPRPAASWRPLPPRSRPPPRSGRRAAAASDDGASPGPSSSPSGGSEALPNLLFAPRSPRTRADWTLGPSLELSADEALDMQMQALADNDVPYRDHGVEVKDPHCLFFRVLPRGGAGPMRRLVVVRTLTHGPSPPPPRRRRQHAHTGSVPLQRPGPLCAERLLRVRVLASRCLFVCARSSFLGRRFSMPRPDVLNPHAHMPPSPSRTKPTHTQNTHQHHDGPGPI
jgi:hypothetical protein